MTSDKKPVKGAQACDRRPEVNGSFSENIAAYRVLKPGRKYWKSPQKGYSISRIQFICRVHRIKGEEIEPPPKCDGVGEGCLYLLGGIALWTQDSCLGATLTFGHHIIDHISVPELGVFRSQLV